MNIQKLKYITLTLGTAFTIAVASCGSSGAQNSSTQESATVEERGQFSADSAYAHVARQVAFGPRVPGSTAHDACADWLTATFRQYGADTVMNLRSDATAWDGKRLPVNNIFARFGTDKAARIILLAHYDTRPWADHDADSDNHLSAIDGANDGASGVGVLLEIARCISLDKPNIGVDILLTDVEDYGATEQADVDDSEETWCLGARAFAANLPYSPSDMPRFGILLDMVGGLGARFNREYFSIRYASAATAKVWTAAKQLGLADRFPEKVGGAITDDHMPLISAGIPVTDIIECNASATGSFPQTWHTMQDNLENIDSASLGAVGRVVLHVIYSE